METTSNHEDQYVAVGEDVELLKKCRARCAEYIKGHSELRDDHYLSFSVADLESNKTPSVASSFLDAIQLTGTPCYCESVQRIKSPEACE